MVGSHTRDSTVVFDQTDFYMMLIQRDPLAIAKFLVSFASQEYWTDVDEIYGRWA